MSKEYTIISSSINPGRNDNAGTNWSNYMGGTGGGNVVGYSSAGYSSSYYRAVNILFNSSDLSQYASKTITSIKLRITVTSGKLGSTSYPYRVRYKLNSTASTSSTGNAWTSSNQAQSAAGSYDLATWSNGNTSGTTTITANSTHDFSVGTTLPIYGYVIGITTAGTASMVLGATATLIITTNETDYTYKLSYNANGGSGAPSAQSKTVTASSTPSMTFTISNTKPTRTGYTFKGWADSASATSAAYSPGGSITLTGNKTIYAVWQLLTYTVKYNANGGSGAPSNQTKEYGVTLTLSTTVPTRTGYDFLGWNSNSAATTATYAAGANYTENAAITLYAIWKKKTYAVKYNANGGSGAPSNQTKEYGVTLTLSTTVPTRTGFTFEGWGTSASATTATYQPGGNYTSNAAITLYAVWAASGSAISAGNGTIGSDLTITINRQNASYTDTISYTFGGATATIVTKTSDTSVTWSIPATLAQQIPNANSGSCTLTCTTYDGDTVVETSSISITLSVPSTMKPTISSVTLSEAVSSVSSQFTSYVKGKSKINVVTSASGIQGSTILSCIVTINDQELSGTNVTTDFLDAAGSQSYSVTVTDSRGKTATSSGTFTVLNYGSPKANITNLVRSDSVSTDVTVSYNWSIYDVGNQNTKRYKIEYRENVSTATWNTAVSETDLSQYSGNSTYTIHNLSDGTSYQIRVTVKDYFTSNSYTDIVKPSDSWVIDVDSIDGSIGFHMEALGDGIDHFAREVVFEDNVEIFEDLDVLGTINAANYGNVNAADVASIGDISTNSNVNVSGALNVLNRVASASLSSVGWYRVCTYEVAGAGSVTGGHGFAVRFNIQKHTSSENHSITLRGTTGSSFIWCDESGHSTTQLIDKIRYTYDPTANYGYVDIHYIGTVARGVGVQFDVYEAGNNSDNVIEYQNLWKSLNLVSVSDTPQDETIITEYTFAKTAYGFNYRGYAKLVSTDFDDITEPGIYMLDGTTMTNGPASYTWAYLLVFAATGSVFKDQMVISSPWGRTNIYSRNYGGSPAQWGTWGSTNDNPQGDLSTTGITVNDGNPSAVSVPTGTWTTISSLTLTKGTWLVYATSRFASNATGYRRHILTSADTDTSANAIQMDDTNNAVNGTYTFCRSLNHYSPGSNKTYYLRVYQDSGSSLNVTGRLYATKII